MRLLIVSLPFIALAGSITSATALFWSKSDRIHPANIESPSRATSCATCHPREFGEWSGSHHAQANRPVSASLDHEAFARGKTVVSGNTKTTPLLLDDGPAFRVEDAAGVKIYRPEMVIGVSPLRQYLIRFPDGRWQTQHVAYDSRSGDWFDSNGDEVRQPGDWGHWTNRSMTWNVQCASCHTTGFEKAYDAAADRYQTTWSTQGVSCSRCHGNLDEHQRHPLDRARRPVLNRRQATENCGSCHARREELTSDDFKPGDDFLDHYRPILVDDPVAYHPDGQINHEDFEYGSFLMSKMAHRGVTCLDCHNPHSGKTRLSWENNALCLQCHTAPGRGGAIPIDPSAHTFHSAGTPGSRCVDCHMPETPYMQRHLRRDHGFTVPDPELTLATGTPNACNRCHVDRDAAWALQKATAWYGDKLKRPSHQRALAVDRARKGDSAVVPELIQLINVEEIPAWKSSLLGTLLPWSERRDVQRLAARNIDDPSPLVRSAAINFAGGASGLLPEGRALLSDPSRLVRLDAVGALFGRTQLPETNQAEFKKYLDHICDQPAGALRRSEFALLQHDFPLAERLARRAAAWDNSPEIRENLQSFLQDKRTP